MKLSDIISKDWSYSLSEFGKVVEGADDLSQCVFIILTTQKGSDPLRPDFGVDLLSYIDAPINIAAANLTQELARQTNKWEPRVTVTRVSYKIEGSQITYKVDWQRADGTTNNTEVTYVR